MIESQFWICNTCEKRAPDVSTIHCTIHRYALAHQALPSCLQEVLAKVVQDVNLIEKSLNHRLFKSLLE